MTIRAVVFDLFDTLVDLSMESLPRVRVHDREFPSTVGGLHEAVSGHKELDLDDFSQVLLEVDREHRVTRHREYLEFPTLLRFEILCERLDLTEPHLPQLLTDIHMGLIRSCTSLPAHHPRVLEELRLRVPLGVCSNFSDSATAQRVLDEYRLAPHLEAVVISEDVGLRKPHAGIFEVVLDRLGVSPAETLHVGDSLEADIAGASAVGMQTAWLRRRVEGSQQRLASYEGARPTFELDDISELLALVEA